MGAEEAGGITFGMFEEKINSQAVREYFETLGLDVWDPWSFFKLLDSDGGGFVEIEEFFLGCLRFSGAARAMDVGKLIQDQTWLIRSQGRFQRRGILHQSCEEKLKVLKQLYAKQLLNNVKVVNPNIMYIKPKEHGMA